MASPLGEGRNLSDDHNVARYCSPRNIVDGIPIPEAFKLRIGETFLSANWLEYFHLTDRHLQLAGIRQTLQSKGFRLNRNGGFAILNVGSVTLAASDVELRFVLLGQPNDPSHTGIFNIPNDSDIAVVMAKAVLELHPAI